MKIRTRYRTHHCGELRATDAGRPATLAGFYTQAGEDGFDLRDRHGRTRITLSPGTPAHVRMKAKDLTPEDVISVSGDVILRVEPDPQSPTGDVYILPKALTVLSKADPLPAELSEEDGQVPTREARLKHRALDLRKPALQRRLQSRAKLLQELRAAVHELDFLEVETPLLSKYAKEEAAAMLVPGKGGTAFALPQTTQTWKQLLIAGGVDRYYQIARCFRNESALDAEKQLEFTVLDLEMAYVEEEDLYATVDAILAHIWSRFLGKKLQTPVRRISYEDALLRFGTDRPDTRFELEIQDVSASAKKWPVPLLQECLSVPDGAVRSFRVPGGRESLDEVFLSKLAKTVRNVAPALTTWFKVEAGQRPGDPSRLTGPLGRSFDQSQVARDAVIATGAQPNDCVFVIGAKHAASAAATAGAARLEVGRHLKLTDRNKHELVWVTDFPYYAWRVWGHAYELERHPFTAPKDEDLSLLSVKERNRVRTKGFDLVLNGVELGAGSLRIHDRAVQQKVFKMLELRDEEISRRFGFLLEAFRYGVPPHGGLAIGVDRLLMQLIGADEIEDVTAFPKSRDCKDLTTDGPQAADVSHVKRLLGA